MSQTAQSDVSQETLPLGQPQLSSTDESFLSAWIAGVELAEPHVFSLHVNHPQQATHWHQLIPNLDKIRKVLPNRPQQDAIFLAAMVSFYNAEEGRKLLSKAGCDAFGFMASIMDARRRAIIASMLAHYTGW